MERNALEAITRPRRLCQIPAATLNLFFGSHDGQTLIDFTLTTSPSQVSIDLKSTLDFWRPCWVIEPTNVVKCQLCLRPQQSHFQNPVHDSNFLQCSSLAVFQILARHARCVLEPCRRNLSAKTTLKRQQLCSLNQRTEFKQD